MKKRTQSREYAVQMMYQADIMDEGPATVTKIFWKSFDRPSQEVVQFAEKLFVSAYPKRAESDKLVSQFLKDSWTLDRLGEMEKCILRVAIDELLYSDTPAYAVLDDYVTLTKKFTDDKTASFVNGLLEKIRNTFGEPAAQNGTKA